MISENSNGHRSTWDMTADVFEGKSGLKERHSFVIGPRLVFIEHDDGSANDPVFEKRQDGLGRAVEIAVDMKECDLSLAVCEEVGKGFVEITDMENDPTGWKVELRRFTSQVQMSSGEVQPRFLKPSERVEGVEVVRDDLQEVVKGSGPVDAEFAIKTFNRNLWKDYPGMFNPIGD